MLVLFMNTLNVRYNGFNAIDVSPAILESRHHLRCDLPLLRKIEQRSAKGDFHRAANGISRRERRQKSRRECCDNQMRSK